MFRVRDVILSEEIATTSFACDISRCKGACCVVGDAGAPVEEDEIPVLEKIYSQLSHRLSDEARDTVKRKGVVQKDSGGRAEITCIEKGDCIFVEHNSQGAATCAIQNAYYRGDVNWEKPVSCHLFPIRLKKISGKEYANYDYQPEICSAGCSRGKREGIYLSDFLEKALKRRYGSDWYDEFTTACIEIRSRMYT
ncbi:MAG: DUF3109 family protein [Balneolaceae bacterium]